LLYGWNGQRLELGSEENLVELFEAEVSRRPAAIAVRAGLEELSYGELNGRANQ
jgi:non-ribosomal peptide synthetase component F